MTLKNPVKKSVCIYIYILLYMCIYIYIYLEVWIYIYIYLCVYIYIYIYICREVCGPHIAVELGCVTHCKNKAFYSLTSATKAGPSP